jgi:organic hydroperoxide reductase OsmC/OhrA
MESKPFTVDVVQRNHFEFDVVFDDASWPSVRVDEPAPLGSGAGPNAARLLAAAVGNCLAASLLFCLDKARVPVRHLRARVEGVLERNERGRFRIAGLSVTLMPDVESVVEGEPTPRFDRCLEIFEDFCVVTQSVREGIDVDVRVEVGGEVISPRALGSGAAG